MGIAENTVIRNIQRKRYLICSCVSFSVVMFVYWTWRERDISLAPISMIGPVTVIALILMSDVLRSRFSLLSPKTMVITGFLTFFTIGATANAGKYQQYPPALIFLCSGLPLK